MSMLTRRDLLRGAVEIAVSTALLSTPAFARRGIGGVIGGLAPGYFPSSHTIAAKQPMLLVYPQPDAATPTWAAHHWYYSDGTTGFYPDIPNGVSFGRFPYIFKKLSGPSWLNFGATIWQAGWVGSDAMAAKYGVLTVTDAAACAADTASYTVSWSVTDQDGNSNTYSYSLAHSSATSHFVFVDNVHGSPSNSGTISSPLDSIQTAFGSTYAATSAYAGAVCVLRGSATQYVLPNYTDISGFANPHLGINGTTKPGAIVGFTGETATLNLSNGTYGTIITASDVFFWNLTTSGGNSSATNFDAFWVQSALNRTTFANITSNGLTYGSAGTDNASMIHTPGSSTQGTYQFIHGCFDVNRQSGSPGNNFALFDWYSMTGGLCQYSSATSSGSCDSAMFPKSDCINCCIRGNFVSFAGGTSGYPFSILQNQYQTSGFDEICYNIAININAIFNPEETFSYDAIWTYRNNVIAQSGGTGLISNNNGPGPGPFVFDSNAVQTTHTPIPPIGTYVQTDAFNVRASSGLLDGTTGKLVGGSGSPYYGTVGAEIA